MLDVAKHPWVQGDLLIRRAALERVFGEARAAYLRDEESCGLLAGPSSESRLVDEVVPMTNRANDLHALDPAAHPRTGRTSFDIDPFLFERELRARAAAARPVKVVYHSHLDVGAYFSARDASAATLGGAAPLFPVAYLVASVRGAERGAEPRVDDHKLFVWSDATSAFVESPLSVVAE